LASAELERNLAITSLTSFNAASYPASPGEEGWQQFAQLVRAVNSGSLPAAQKAYDKFTQSPAASVADTHPDSRLAQALSEIGPALQDGDIGRAQQALSSLQPPRRGAPAQRVAAAQAPSLAPAADPMAPGASLDVRV
jgi:hypothetical protein